MTETGILSVHRQRQAFVYIRQSSPSQVERNTESTRRQYALAARAEALGWHPDRITVVDEDLGLSGESADKRDGFNSRISVRARLLACRCAGPPHCSGFQDRSNSPGERYPVLDGAGAGCRTLPRNGGSRAQPLRELQTLRGAATRIRGLR